MIIVQLQSEDVELLSLYCAEHSHLEQVIAWRGGVYVFAWMSADVKGDYIAVYREVEPTDLTSWAQYDHTPSTDGE